MGILGISGPIHQHFVEGLPTATVLKSLWQKKWDQIGHPLNCESWYFFSTPYCRCAYFVQKSFVAGLYALVSTSMQHAFQIESIQAFFPAFIRVYRRKTEGNHSHTESRKDSVEKQPGKYFKFCGAFSIGKEAVSDEATQLPVFSSDEKLVPVHFFSNTFYQLLFVQAPYRRKTHLFTNQIYKIGVI